MTGYTISVKDQESRIKQIQDILNRGNYVKFVRGDNAYKVVTKWNPDKDGDLTSEYVSPEMTSKFVCPLSNIYSIEEVSPSGEN